MPDPTRPAEQGNTMNTQDLKADAAAAADAIAQVATHAADQAVRGSHRLVDYPRTAVGMAPGPRNGS